MLRRRVFGIKTWGDSTSLVPDSVASPWMDKEKEDEELESLVFSSEKECLNLLHKKKMEAPPKKKTDSGKKLVTASTLETAMKDYTDDYDSLLISLSTVSCLAQERNIRRKRMQALARQFARVNCEGGERVFGYLNNLVVRGRMEFGGWSLVNTVWERLEGMKSSR